MMMRMHEVWNGMGQKDHSEAPARIDHQRSRSVLAAEAAPPSGFKSVNKRLRELTSDKGDSELKRGVRYDSQN